MFQTILILTAVMSYACLTLSVVLCLYFLRHRRHPLGRAVSFMLMGEAMGMGVVATFATLELCGVLPDFPAAASTGIRWVALLATAASSIHLSFKVHEIVTE